MRKWLIETIILSSLVGAYIMYGQTFIDNLAQTYGLGPSSYFYALGAVVIIIVASVIGRLITRGLHKN